MISGLPRKAVISSEEVREALKEPVGAIIDCVTRVLEKAEPELSADLVDNGIALAEERADTGNEHRPGQRLGTERQNRRRPAHLRGTRHRRLPRKHRALERHPWRATRTSSSPRRFAVAVSRVIFRGAVNLRELPAMNKREIAQLALQDSRGVVFLPSGNEKPVWNRDVPDFSYPPSCSEDTQAPRISRVPSWEPAAK